MKRGTDRVAEDPALTKILDHLLRCKGFDGRHYKPNYVKRRVAVRMRVAGASTYAEYLDRLKADPDEASHLFDRLTIHVTEFFRDPDVYRTLAAKVLPLLPLGDAPRIRAWCAGCSTGEEPYSLAILLEDWLRDHPGIGYEILATDLDTPSVRSAERGEYPPEALRRLTRAQVSRWFREEAGRMQVQGDLRKRIRFRVHDLLGPWGHGHSDFHLILCRNLLIYMTGPQQQQVYERFAAALVPGGYLVLGLTETLLGASRKFYECVDVKHRIYRTTGTAGGS
jgi:chemotaxis protein methyltransferase CheR